MIPAGVMNPNEGEPAGISYAGVFTAAPREEVLAALSRERFTGWLGPQEGHWVIAVAQNARGTVAARGRSVADVAGDLAAEFDAVTLAAEVDRDRRLRLWGYRGSERVVWFDSAPAEDEEAALGEVVLDEFGEPVPGEAFASTTGSEHAETFTRLCGADTETVEELEELLEEELSEDVSESERLTAALRLLGLPTWLVASGSLPRWLPGGPATEEFTRLGAGRTGIAGRLTAALTRPLRRRARPG